MKYFVLTFCLFSACSLDKSSENPELIKEQIIQLEKDFAELSQKASIATAFLHYAAEDAVLLRGNELIKGKNGIKSYLEGLPKRNEKLDWAPSFVDVSSSGDLAYTYGNYSYTRIDSTGEKIESNGIFHTVWKKQTDGTWKFVWD